VENLFVKYSSPAIPYSQVMPSYPNGPPTDSASNRAQRSMLNPSWLLIGERGGTGAFASIVAMALSRHHFPPAVIRHAVWLYMRFTLSYRDVEDLLAERGWISPTKRCDDGY
jgi:hypothetical protein